MSLRWTPKVTGSPSPPMRVVTMARLRRVRSRLVFIAASISVFSVPVFGVPISTTPMPSPQARGFLVTEFGAAHRLGACSRSDAADSKLLVHIGAKNACPLYALRRRQYYFSKLGFMVNLNRTYSVGLSHLIAMDEGGENRGGPVLTVRRWFGDPSSVDLSAGLYWWDTRSPSRRPSAQVSLAFNWSDWLAIVTQLESTDFPGVGDDHGLYVGLRTGAGPGLVLNSIAAVAGIVVGVGVLVTGTD